MSDKKLSALDAVTTVEDTDEFLVARSGASKKITGANLKAAAGSGGGSSPIEATATVTTDGTFRAFHVFDLGEGPHLVYVNIVLVSLAPDGEPTGTGGIGVIDAAADDGPGWATSNDGATYGAAASSLAGIGDVDDVSGMMVTPGENVSVVLTTLRYLKLMVSIQTTADFTTYAGGNDPVASVRLDLVYT